MKMKKKIMSLVLAVVMCMYIGCPVFAMENVIEEDPVIVTRSIDADSIAPRTIYNLTKIISTESDIELYVSYQYNDSYNSFGSINPSVEYVPSGIIVSNVDYSFETDVATGDPYVLFTVYFYKNNNYSYTYAETARLYKPF